MENIKNYEVMAKLDLPEEERRQVSELADMLLGSFEALASVDTDGVKPMYTVLDITNVMRKDVSLRMVSRDELLEAAPSSQRGYFTVPRALSKR